MEEMGVAYPCQDLVPAPLTTASELDESYLDRALPLPEIIAQPRQTPMHDWHLAQNAQMAEFGGYHMPLWYPWGAKEEHLSVLTKAGLFDTSHMAVLLICGPDAFGLLQQCHTKDLRACVGPKQAPLSVGRCTYGVFLNPEGGVLDDAIIYQAAAGLYMVVVNAGMAAKVAAHLEPHTQGLDVQVLDLTDRLGKLDVQGPAAAKILWNLVRDPNRVFHGLPYFAFKGFFLPLEETPEPVLLHDGTPILLSRTGYTGEFGFEIWLPARRALQLWSEILEAGQPHGLKACGLAARDSLRGGALLPLSHQDIGSWPFIDNPWAPLALPYTPDGKKFSKDFVGRQAIERAEGREFTLPFVGFDPRKVPTHDGQARVIDWSGADIGSVLTCVSDMGIDRVRGGVASITSPDKPADFAPKGLCCGFVKVNRRLSVGEEITLSHGRRRIRVLIAQDIRPDRSARKPLDSMLN